MSFSDKKLTKGRLTEILDGDTPAPGEGSDLGDLGDVTLTTPVNGDVLTFNGTAWVNAPISISVAFDDVTGTPTTIAGYGITDSSTRVAAPSGPTASGALGQYAVDADFVYFATGADTWIRVAKDETWA